MNQAISSDINKQKEALAAKLAARKRKSKLLSAAPPSGETTKPIFEVEEEDQFSTPHRARHSMVNEQRESSPLRGHFDLDEEKKTSNSISPEGRRSVIVVQEPLNFAKEMDVSSANNKSTTTTGAGLANKIG